VTMASDFAQAARALRGGSLAEWFANDFTGLDTHADAVLVEVWSAALAFTDGELPFDAEAAELRDDVWQRWLAHDPVRLVAEHADAASRLRAVWLDAGDADTYFLDLAAVALRRAFVACGLSEDRLRFELFPGGHRGLSWRYPLSLKFLVGSLSITL
jgi:hypothetical protein